MSSTHSPRKPGSTKVEPKADGAERTGHEQKPYHDARRTHIRSAASTFRPRAQPHLPESAADQLARSAKQRATAPLRDAQSTKPALERPTLGIQAKCGASCGCDTCLKKSALAVQRKAANVPIQAEEGAPKVPPPEQVLATLGPGAPLPTSTLGRLEASFGRALGSIRVHANSRAALAMGARAFAVGHHIAFAPGELSPGTPDGDRLIAHEVAHVIQQSGGAGVVQGAGMASHDHEAEADHAANVATSGGKVKRLTPVRRGVQGNFIGDIGRGIKKGAVAVGEGIKDVAEAGWDLLVDQFWKLVRSIAPEAEPYLRHPTKLWDLVKEAVGSGIDKLFGAIFGALKGISIFGAASAFFTKFLPAIGKVQQAIAKDDHPGIVAGIKQAMDAFGDMSDAMFAPIKKVFNAVSGLLKAAFEKVLLPIFDLLKSVAKGIYDVVEGFIDGVVSVAKAIGGALGKVWKWIKSTLGFGGGGDSSDSKGGIWSRIKKWAGDLWDGVKDTVLKFVEPLKTLGKVLLIVSPVGPIILAFKYGPKIVHWLKDLWAAVSNPKNIPRARAMVLKVLRGLTAFLQSVAAKLGVLASELQEKLEAISKPLAAVSEALGASTILKVLSTGIRLVATAIDKGVTWVQKNVPPFIQKVGAFFSKVWTWAKPIIDILVRVIMVVSNPLGIPMLVAGWVWGRLPVWLKVVIIVFVLEILIRFVAALPDSVILVGAGPLAALVKHAILGFLRKIEGEGGGNIDKAVAVADRVARLLQGGSLEFVGGYAVGILSGIWDGITGPIEMVVMVIEGVASIAEWLDKKASELPQDLAAIFAKAASTAQTIKANAWPAIKSVFSGEGGGMGKVLSLLKGAWGAITGAAAGVGGAVADALMSFLMLPDYELGKKLGWVTGTVIFEVALAVLTGGASAALKAAQGPIARIVKLIVKMHEYMGKVFEEILHFLPGIQRAMEKAFSAIAESPALKPILAALKGLFKDIESASARALGRLSGEASTEAASVAAREAGALGRTEEAAGRAEAKVETQVTKTETETTAAAETKATQAETKEAREARVKDTEHVENANLSKADVDAQLKHLEENPHLMEGTPPNRKAKIGDHTWEEQPGGGWCRHSTGELCTPNNAVPEKLKTPEDAKVKAKGEEPAPKDPEVKRAEEKKLRDEERAQQKKKAQEDKAWEERKKALDDPAKKAKQEEKAWADKERAEARDARELKQTERAEAKAELDAEAAARKAEREEARSAAKAEAEKLLDESGKKFKDPDLQKRYDDYVKRKTAANEPIRDPAEWKVESDWWKHESPTARGNEFNKTAGADYQYNELNLEAPKKASGAGQSGKRLDSYKLDPANPASSEIVSRKAVDFDKIDKSTFNDYVRELKTKYPPGTTIRSNAYPELDGTVLQGKQVLEVPATNQGTEAAKAFEAIAQKEGITIRYRAE